MRHEKIYRKYHNTTYHIKSFYWSFYLYIVRFLLNLKLLTYLKITSVSLSILFYTIFV